jgi:hypothetical protein
MFYSPERKNNVRINPVAIVTKIKLVQKTAHSVHADPPSSRPTWLVFLVLDHIIPAFVGH